MASPSSSPALSLPILSSAVKWSFSCERWTQFHDRKSLSPSTSSLMNVRMEVVRKWDGLQSPRAIAGGQWAAVGWCHWGKKSRKGRRDACKPRGPLWGSPCEADFTQPEGWAEQSSKEASTPSSGLQIHLRWPWARLGSFWWRTKLIHIFSCYKA